MRSNWRIVYRDDECIQGVEPFLEPFFIICLYTHTLMSTSAIMRYLLLSLLKKMSSDHFFYLEFRCACWGTCCWCWRAVVWVLGMLHGMIMFLLGLRKKKRHDLGAAAGVDMCKLCTIFVEIWIMNECVNEWGCWFHPPKKETEYI
jgi:hypothetical protein